MAHTGLYWFTNDLRLTDNPALTQAASDVDQLVCALVVEPRWFSPNHYADASMGEHRWRFFMESVKDLQQALKERGQTLILLHGSPLDALSQLIGMYDIASIYRSDNAGVYENAAWQALQKRYRLIKFVSKASHTLFEKEQLPFALNALPKSFTAFKKSLAQHTPKAPLPAPIRLPKAPNVRLLQPQVLPPVEPRTHTIVTDMPFYGGATAAQAHSEAYFSSSLPSHYKEVRNALDGWDNSTKFSPWLANGSLSVRQLAHAVTQYEAYRGANDSTYWIYFELLWREYFQWYAHAHTNKLFKYAGIKATASRCCFYPERYQRWCHGNTPYPIVNACMKQLNATGYMSNRGRQLVASCFVNELNLDWRFGAAYFEQQLIDYDVAANWGNWQYLAGVGADPKGKRHFDLEKQAALYDPDGEFIRHWKGQEHDGVLDSVDAADWPIG